MGTNDELEKMFANYLRDHLTLEAREHVHDGGSMTISLMLSDSTGEYKEMLGSADIDFGYYCRCHGRDKKQY